MDSMIKNFQLTLVVSFDHHICHGMFDTEMNNPGPDVKNFLTIRALFPLGTLQRKIQSNLLCGLIMSNVICVKI